MCPRLLHFTLLSKDHRDYGRQQRAKEQKLKFYFFLVRATVLLAIEEHSQDYFKSGLVNNFFMAGSGPGKKNDKATIT